MIRTTSILIAAATLASSVSPVRAQNPGQHVSVDIAVTSLSVTGDTTRVSYSVSNLGSSSEPLWQYYVDAPGGVLRMATAPAPARWLTDTDFGGRPMAGWMFLDNIVPGAATPILQFDAVGLPGIVTFWAGGYYELPEGDDALVTDSTVLPDLFTTNKISGQTVGVDRWPTDRSAQALLSRLRVLTQSSCAAPTHWITDSSLCTQLLADLDQAESARANGQAAEARSVLAQYDDLLLGGNTSGVVKSMAYRLLKSNSDIVSATL
jgi:hypothetical protein